MQVKFNPISGVVGKWGYKVNDTIFKIKLKKKGNKMKIKTTEIQNNINPKYYEIYNEIIKDACENMGIKNINASWINVEYEEQE